MLTSAAAATTAASSAAVYASVAATVAAIAATTVSTVNSIQNQKALEAQNKYNAKVAEEDAQRAQAESAMNRSLARASGRKKIAEAKNQMSAMGNIGSSADSSIYDAFLNLDSDLGAMRYQYDNTAVKYLNESANYKYNAKIASKNKQGALLGGMLKIGSQAISGYKDYSEAGGKYGFNYWKGN